MTQYFQRICKLDKNYIPFFPILQICIITQGPLYDREILHLSPYIYVNKTINGHLILSIYLTAGFHGTSHTWLIVLIHIELKGSYVYHVNEYDPVYNEI